MITDLLIYVYITFFVTLAFVLVMFYFASNRTSYQLLLLYRILYKAYWHCQDFIKTQKQQPLRLIMVNRYGFQRILTGLLPAPA